MDTTQLNSENINSLLTLIQEYITIMYNTFKPYFDIFCDKFVEMVSEMIQHYQKDN